MSPRSVNAPLLATLVLLGVYLSPVLKTGFIFDDAWNSSVRGMVGLHGNGFWGFIAHSLTQTIRISGRGLPLLFVFGFGVFYVVGTQVFLYKVYMLVITVVAATVFWTTMNVLRSTSERREPSARRTATLALLLAIPCLQLRSYHDSVVAYFGLMQVMLMLLCGATILYLRWLRGGHVRNAFGAAGFFLVACLLYEMSPMFAVLFVALGMNERLSLRTAIGRALPFGAIAAVFVVVVLVERATAVTPNVVYSGAFSPDAVARAFGFQLAAVAPLTFHAFDPNNHLPTLGTALRSSLPMSVAVGALAAGIAWWVVPPFGGRSDGARSGYWPLLVFLALPAAALSYVVKYQAELRWGFGYLPVFMQVFAVGGLLAGAIHKTGNVFRSSVPRLTMALVLGALVAAGYASNRATADVLELAVGDREAVEEALADGLLDNVKEDSTIFVGPRDWFTRDFAFHLAKKRVNPDLRQVPAVPACDVASTSVVVLSTAEEGRLSVACADPAAAASALRPSP